MIGLLRNLFVGDVWLKLFSLGLGILIWFTVSRTVYDRQTSASVSLPDVSSQEQTYFNIEVQVLASAADVRSFKVSPSEVEVTVRGETNLLNRLQAKDIHALVDLTGIESGGLSKRIEVTTPAGVTFVRVSPEEVHILVPPNR